MRVLCIVEGWISEQALKEVIKYYKATDYKMIITTGGLIKTRNSTKYKTSADSAAPFSVPSSSETGYSNKISKQNK